MEAVMSKPRALEVIEDKVTTVTGQLEPRERALLVAAIIIIVVACVFTAFNFIYKSIDAQIAETEGYRRSLNFIADNQSTYLANRAKKDAMRQRLLNADSKVVNKLTSMASSLGFDVTVTPKDPHKTSDDSGAEEQEIEVTIKNVEYSKYLEYLVQIHKLDTPIYMRHLNMTRTSALSNSDTKMSGTITLMSYRLKEQNAT